MFGHKIMLSETINEFQLKLNADGSLNISDSFIHCDIPRRVFKDIYRFKPDIIISDFEASYPCIGYAADIPVILVDGVRSFVESGSMLESFSSKLFSWANVSIDYGLKSNNPLVDPKLLKTQVLKEDFILGYNTYPETPVIDFSKVDGYPVKIANMLSREDYYEALQACNYVVCNGNQGVIIDAIALGKPIICWPIPGHDLQQAVAKYCQEHFYGFRVVRYIQELNETIANGYAKPIQTILPTNSLDRICQKIQDTITKLL